MDGLVLGTHKPPRIVLYGPPGVGKSTFGADSPKPVFILTENGLDNVPVDQTPKLTAWPDVVFWVKRLATEKHDFKTVVIDTLNGVVDLCAQHVCTTMYGGQWTAKKGDGGFLAWGQGWKAASEEMRVLLAGLDECREKGLTILMLAHTGIQSVKNPIDGDYTKFAPDVDKTVWARVAAWSDIILRADYDYSVVRGGNPNAKGRAVGTTTRKLICAGSAAEDAKTRVGFELPDTMPLSWTDFAASLGKESETLTEIAALWPLLTPAEAKKTLAWLGVASVKDATTSQARKLLDALRRKQAEKATTEQAQTAAPAAGSK